MLALLFVCFAAPAQAQGPDARCVIETARITPADGEEGDWFGRAIDLSLGRAAVGAPHESSAGPDAGSVYVVRALGESWAHEQKLIGSLVVAGDRFGEAVALQGDTLLVGAPLADLAGNAAGAVYVFERFPSGWSETAILQPSDLAAGQEFGRSLGFRGDDLIVGSPMDDDLGPASGSAYVFTRSAGFWTEQAKLTSPAGGAVELFGSAVDIDGDLALVGSKNGPGTVPQTGAADVFVRTAVAWSHERHLSASDGAAGDDFGISVALELDTALIGARAATGSAASSGAVYAFERGPGLWRETQKISALDGQPFDDFGHDLALEGARLVVGAFGDELDGGSAYVFARDSGTWLERAKIRPSDVALNDAFGWAVALEGSLVAVGAWRKDVALPEMGASYVFRIAEEPLAYCTSKSSARGCAPTIRFSGHASATAGSGFLVYAENVDNQTSGLLLYGVAERNAPPFRDRLFCNRIPSNRTRPVPSGGTAPPDTDCSGALTIDMNAFAAGSLPGNPLAELSEPGRVVTCRWWSRDPSGAGIDGLSDVLLYTVCP